MFPIMSVCMYVYKYNLKTVTFASVHFTSYPLYDIMWISTEMNSSCSYEMMASLKGIVAII